MHLYYGSVRGRSSNGAAFLRPRSRPAIRSDRSVPGKLELASCDVVLLEYQGIHDEDPELMIVHLDGEGLEPFDEVPVERFEVSENRMSRDGAACAFRVDRSGHGIGMKPLRNPRPRA